MARRKVSFENPQGEVLAGLLETPQGPPRAYALFAHCFTCSKDIIAASRITRALAARGIAVLRFDFTGLGNSDGDFANSNFSSNVQDLIAAVEHLRSHYAAPELLIGHSLGGAAVLIAAQLIASVRAVVTIGAPATAEHVKALFATEHADIIDYGEAMVDLAGRRFTIRKQFLDDIRNYNTSDHIGRLGRALLIFHSPADRIVPIDEAAKIYRAARHPKSFVSLDQADHLLSAAADAEYVAEVTASWAGRYLTPPVSAEEPARAPELAPGQVLVAEEDRAYTRRIYTERHQLLADEPASAGGADRGANPYELLLAALGACTSITLRMYADRKQMDLQDIEVSLGHSRVHCRDCADCDCEEGFVDRIDRAIRLQGDLSAEERQRLLEIADKCPVHKTLHNQIVVKTTLL